MKQLAALAWKEWHEARAFLWIALGVFVGLPVIAGLEAMIQLSRRFEISTAPWVLSFGGVLAIFVAVGTTCRDFSGHLEDFWRSRPVGVVRWLLVKYFVGFIVVVVACLVPLLLEFSLNRQRGSDWREAWFPYIAWAIALSFMLPMLYSLGFLAGCLVRRPAHAAMLALAAALLTYLLPIVLPPLSWLNVAGVASLYSAEVYAAGTLGLAVVAMALAIVAAVRGWRVEAGRKMLYGAVAVAVLILFDAAAFQLGTNMPILQAIPFEPGETAIRIGCDGNHGFVVTYRQHDPSDPRPNDTVFRKFELTPSGIKLGDGMRLGIGAFGLSRGEASPPGHPEISYGAYEFHDDYVDDIVHCNLAIGDIETNFYDILPIWSVHGETAKSDGRMNPNWEETPVVYIWKDRLYVIGRSLVTLDINTPLSPRIISRIPFSSSFAAAAVPNGSFLAYRENTDGPIKWSISLPPIPGLPPEPRLAAALAAQDMDMFTASCFDGEFLCEAWGNTLTAYRLTKLTDTKATFKQVGQYTPSILERAFGAIGSPEIQIQNGLVYVSYSAGWSRFLRSNLMFNPQISVFDLHGNPPLRLVGHFAAPGAAVAYALPDGRAVVGGRGLWLVGPPPGRR